MAYDGLRRTFLQCTLVTRTTAFQPREAKFEMRLAPWFLKGRNIYLEVLMPCLLLQATTAHVNQDNRRRPFRPLKVRLKPISGLAACNSHFHTKSQEQRYILVFVLTMTCLQRLSTFRYKTPVVWRSFGRPPQCFNLRCPHSTSCSSAFHPHVIYSLYRLS